MLNYYQIERLKIEARRILSQWVKSADIIEAQIEFGNPIWLRTFTNGIGSSVDRFAKDIQRVEVGGRVRKTTWPRDRHEARTSRNTMGYQIRSLSANRVEL